MGYGSGGVTLIYKILQPEEHILQEYAETPAEDIHRYISVGSQLFTEDEKLIGVFSKRIIAMISLEIAEHAFLNYAGTKDQRCYDLLAAIKSKTSHNHKCGARNKLTIPMQHVEEYIRERKIANTYDTPTILVAKAIYHAGDIQRFDVNSDIRTNLLFTNCVLFAVMRAAPSEIVEAMVADKILSMFKDDKWLFQLE